MFGRSINQKWIPKTAITFLSVVVASILLTCCVRSDRQLEQQSINALLKQAEKWRSWEDFDQVYQYSQEILRREPDHYEALLLRAISYQKNLEFEIALLDFNRCIELEPDNPEAHHEFAAFWSDQGKFEKAIEAYTKALEADPSMVRAYGARASTQFVLGRLDLAIRDINNAIILDPKMAVLYNIRGHILDRRGDCWGARRDFEKAAKMEPKRGATECIAWMLATCADPLFRDGDQAFEMAVAAAESSRTHGSVRALAAACAEIGDFRNAIFLQEEAVDLISKDKQTSGFAREYLKWLESEYRKELESYRNYEPWHRQTTEPANGSTQ